MVKRSRVTYAQLPIRLVHHGELAMMNFVGATGNRSTITHPPQMPTSLDLPKLSDNAEQCRDVYGRYDIMVFATF